MTSSDEAKGWTPILLEAAEKVRSRVRQILLSRLGLDVTGLKKLLDSSAQEAISETLRGAGSPARIVSEEGDYSIGEGGPYIVVDPVDGTTNAARGIPIAVTSLAASETRCLTGVFTGVVMDLHTGEAFMAERGRGAWRDGKRVKPAGAIAVMEALVSIDVSKGASIEPVTDLIREARHLRQLGSSALSLCLVASGVIDAHVDIRGSLRATDVAAGLFILKEAGGMYSIDGEIDGDLELARETTLRLVAASCPETLEALLKHVT